MSKKMSVWSLAITCLCGMALLSGCPKAEKAPETKLQVSNMSSIPGDSAPTETQPPAQSPVVIPAGLTESSFAVEGMHCSDCSSSIEATVIKLPGVSTVAADWKGGSVKVQYDPAKLKSDDIIAAINSLAYKCKLADTPVSASQEKAAEDAKEPQGA